MSALKNKIINRKEETEKSHSSHSSGLPAIFFVKIMRYEQRALNELRMRLKALPQEIKRVSSLSLSEMKSEYKALRTRERVNFNELNKALALAGDLVKRLVGIEPYEEQYLCAAALTQGYMAEMKTGEGKTLAGVLAAIALALRGKVHLVTVNDYLAADALDKYREVYAALGLHAEANARDADKAKVYCADVVYSSSQELAWDFLRNRLLPRAQQSVFPFDAVIIDEADFVLLDNANSHFSVGGEVTFVPPREPFETARALVAMMRGEEREREDELLDLPTNPENAHYVYYRHNRTVYLTELGLKFLGEFFHVDDIVATNFRMYKTILSTLEAQLFFLNGRDYIVKDNRIILINRENGRLLPNSQLDIDLHTAIEVKERLPITEKPLLSEQISYQMFFGKYKHICGMSGTLKDAAAELKTLFGTETVAVPTHRPNRRLDRPDVVFKTKEDKYRYLADFLALYKPKAQPALIITESEAESAHVLEILKKANIAANLLNAQTAEREAELVRYAGTHGAVTVSTNIAGRGTDIVLDDAARTAGGLFVVVLNHYRSRRVDNQARGRAGRQGEVGECVFFVSLEDELWQYADESQADKIRALSPKEGKFGRKESRMLAQMAVAIQNNVNSLLRHQREVNFFLDRVIEQIRDWTQDWGNALQGWSFEQWKTYIQRNPQLGCLLKELNAESNLLELVMKKRQSLGEEMARKLLSALIELVVRREWLFLKRDLENLKAYLPLKRITEDRYVDEFIRISHRMRESFEFDVMKNTLGYFVTSSAQD